jgi:hypothetical protein
VAQGNEPEGGRSWMQDKLAKLEAVYRKFGRDGLREHPLPDVNLLLQSKELAFRDLPKGRDQMEHQKADARQLELEIKDISGYVRSQVALVVPTSLSALRQYGERSQHKDQQQRSDYQRDGKSRGGEK